MSTANFRIYALGSFLLATAVVLNVYYTKEQFYLMCVQLVTTKGNLMVLGNLAFVMFVLFGKVFQKIFLGNLRDVEVEHLTDKLWTTAMDTLLIMTIFRDEFNMLFLSLFVFLLFMKIFHWLAQDRVDFFQQTPTFSLLAHVRVASLLCIILAVDFMFILISTKITIALHGQTMMLLFGFEYLLLISSAICTIVKYLLNHIDRQYNERWENKGAYVLYLEFMVDAYRLFVFVTFFGAILTCYGFIPLHIIRQLWITFISFQRRATDVIKYRKATFNMNTRFPNATEQELRETQTCIVCREDMNEGKKLPCGHILHMHCLRSWLERQQVCPICRMPVLYEELPVRTIPIIPQRYPPPFQYPVTYALQQQQQQQSSPALPSLPPEQQQPEQPKSMIPPSEQELYGASNLESASSLDPLEQIQVIQQQITLITLQLQNLQQSLLLRQSQSQPQPYHHSNQTRKSSPSVVSLPPTSNNKDNNEERSLEEKLEADDEEELIQRAIKLSLKELVSTENSLTSSDSNSDIDNGNRIPTLKEDIDADSSKGDNSILLTDVKKEHQDELGNDPERDELRKRRLIRFSQQ